MSLSQGGCWVCLVLKLPELAHLACTHPAVRCDNASKSVEAVLGRQHELPEGCPARTTIDPNA